MTIKPLDAENAVIGSILISPNCLPVVEELLSPHDFSLEANRVIYQAALSLSGQKRPVDPFLVWGEAARMGMQVSKEYILQLMDITPTAANVREYAAQTRENAVRRGILEMAESCKSMLSEHTPPEEILEATVRTVVQLQQQGTANTLIGPDEAALAFYRHREAVESGTAAGYVRTNYQDLDDLLGGGMLCSGMYILAARPGMGKTTRAINMMDRLARNGVPVLFVSLEMDTEQIEAKRLARECGIPANRLLMEGLTDAEQQAAAEGMDVIRSWPVYIDTKPSVTVAHIESEARKIQGLGLIVIDYLGKISPREGRSRSSRYEYTTEISGDIKTLARTFKVPVLTLAQLNRENEQRADPVPKLSDLRDTGAIEQDADGVIFLHCEAYYTREQKPTAVEADLQAIVAKNRHGPTGECMLSFDMAHSLMRSSRKRSTSRKQARQAKRAEPKPRQMTWDELKDKWEAEEIFTQKEADIGIQQEEAAPTAGGGGAPPPRPGPPVRDAGSPPSGDGPGPGDGPGDAYTVPF